jgi:HTH-type transcriptional regulator/antitoxin HipB
MRLTMQNLISVSTPEQLGRLVRATRKWQQLNQDEIGAFSHSFIGEVESGKPTAQVGKVIETLLQLGIRLHVELPPGMPPPST